MLGILVMNKERINHLNIILSMLLNIHHQITISWWTFLSKIRKMPLKYLFINRRSMFVVSIF